MTKANDEILINWFQASLSNKSPGLSESVTEEAQVTDVLNISWQQIKQDPVLVALFYNHIPAEQRASITIEELSNFINNLGNQQVSIKPNRDDIIAYTEPESIVNQGQIDTSLVTFARIDRVVLYNQVDTTIKTWKDAIESILGYFALHNPNKMIEFFHTKSIELADNPHKVRRPLPVKNMNLWYESNKSAINIATDINKIIKYFGATDHFEIEYHSK